MVKERKLKQLKCLYCEVLQMCNIELNWGGVQKPSPREPVEGSNWNRQGGSVFFDNQNMLDGANLINEGYLYKKGKIVRNWKLRWFMMDTEKGEVRHKGQTAARTLVDRLS